MDIMVCGNTKCKLKEECLRYLDKPEAKMLNWLSNPIQNCVNKEFLYFVNKE